MPPPALNVHTTNSTVWVKVYELLRCLHPTWDRESAAETFRRYKQSSKADIPNFPKLKHQGAAKATPAVIDQAGLNWLVEHCLKKDELYRRQSATETAISFFSFRGLPLRFRKCS